MPVTRAAVGFAIHTGWVAAVVLVAKPLAIRDRRRIELAGDDVRFVYHLAAEHGDAERRVAEVTRAARRRATAALQELCGAHRIVVAGLPRPKRVLPPLDAILRSHTLIHTAEGELYRLAIADACRGLELEVLTPEPLLPEVESPGRPWGKDQRDAAALAFAALIA